MCSQAFSCTPLRCALALRRKEEFLFCAFRHDFAALARAHVGLNAQATPASQSRACLGTPVKSCPDTCVWSGYMIGISKERDSVWRTAWIPTLRKSGEGWGTHSIVSRRTNRKVWASAKRPPHQGTWECVFCRRSRKSHDGTGRSSLPNAKTQRSRASKMTPIAYLVARNHQQAPHSTKGNTIGLSVQ